MGQLAGQRDVRVFMRVIRAGSQRGKEETKAWFPPAMCSKAVNILPALAHLILSTLPTRCSTSAAPFDQYQRGVVTALYANEAAVAQKGGLIKRLSSHTRM